jgi:hypothetical protein
MCSAAVPIAPGAFAFEIGAVGGDSMFCQWSMMGRGISRSCIPALSK